MTPTPLAAAPFSRPASARGPVAAPAPLPAAPAPAGHLPHARYRLANGLTVVLHPYAAAPLVHVDVTYHVGSGHDAPGPTGLAHFCEHLLFEGSRHVAAGEHQRRVKAAGGTANALTDRDRTSYFQTAPAPALELLLWLEADRMGCLADTLTPAALETQRAIILQERTQTCDERAYGRAPEHVSQALYPAGHPYASLPIGARADIARLTLADVQAFLGRWYAPTNATLTIGGDFDPAEARRWVARYFGGLPAGQPAPAPRPRPAPALPESRRVVVAEAVRLPLLQVVWPTVPRYHPAAPALDALAEVIGQGKNSLLFQSLVRTQLAVQVSVAHTPGTLAGELTISVLGRPEVPLATLEAAVWAAVRAAADPAALPDALLRFATRRAAGLLGQLDSLAERVKQLASHARHLGQPDYLPTYLAELRALRPAAVLRAHATYLLDRPAVLLHVLPLAAAPAASAATPAPTAVMSAGPVNLADLADLANPAGLADPASLAGTADPAVTQPLAGSARPALRDDFDRSVAPAPGPARPLPLPSCWRDALPNGLQLIGSARSAIPSFTLALGLPGGRRLEQAVPGQPAGLAALTAAMLNEGSRRYASAEFTAALNRLGSTIHVGAAADQTTVYVQSLSEHLPATLALLEERLLHPRFEPADFARLRQQTLEALGHQQTQAPALADRLLTQALYAPTDVLSQPLAGTLASVAPLQLADVKEFYRRAYQPAGAVLAAVGNQSLAQFDPFLDFLHGWQAAAPAGALATGQPAAPAGAGRRLYFLHQAGAQQAELRVGSLAPAYDATGDYYRASLVAFLLGGSPDSRLARRLRHTHGYAYSVRAGLAGLRCPAPFTVQAAVRPEAAAPALAAIWEEIAALQAGVTDEELHFLQTALRQQDARRYETNQQRAFFLLHLAQHGLPADYVHRQHALLAGLRPAEVAAFATRHLPLVSLQTVVVGDGARLLPGLRAAGFEVAELALGPGGALAPR